MKVKEKTRIAATEMKFMRTATNTFTDYETKE
jgi:hypothetical protein